MDNRPLIDRHRRNINYLRVSITDRCNLNCLYCRPGVAPSHLPHQEILSYEEILRLITISSHLGVNKVRITGGEPLVRKDAVPFLERVAGLPGLADISLTTNGLLLGPKLAGIKAAGITRLNISLDTLNREKYKKITGHDVFDRVWKNIMGALDMGFSPVKLNMVVMKGVNDDEVGALAALSIEQPLHIRFIEHMPIGHQKIDKARQILTPEIKERVATAGELLSLTETVGQTAERFRFKGAQGEVGFISPLSKHFCQTCNRLRLTAEGKLKSCLLSERTTDIKSPLRSGASDDELSQIIRQAVLAKPVCSGANGRHPVSLSQEMSAIGG